MQERGKNKQLFINMLASFISFGVGTGIGLLLTPYIVKRLGAEAYGFVGLSNTLISYAGLVTVALNGMSGRFIALAYNKGQIAEANKYYSSVFYANAFMSAFITLAFVGCTIWLEYMINIPDEMLLDVKCLFALLALTNVISMMTGVYGTATYIKNRLDLSSVRTIISQVLRSVILLIAFGLFSAKIWYIGLSGIICTFYLFITNIYLAHKLTPDLRVNKRNFDWIKIKELLTTGVWNLITKIGDLLANGVDLLFANIFIGPAAMGVFAVTKTVPAMVQALMANVSGVFGPILLQLYAKDDKDGIANEIQTSIRIQAIMSAVPLSILYVLGEEFYRLWLPTQNAHWLYILTIAATSSMALWQPLESLWNIFTITNKVKLASLAILLNNGLTFLIAFIAMFVVESPEIRLLILAGTKNVLKFILTSTFLPIVTARLIGVSGGTFYPIIIKYVSGFITICVIGLIIKQFVNINSWHSWIICSCVLGIICMVIYFFAVLKSTDRVLIQSLIFKILPNK